MSHRPEPQAATRKLSCRTLFVSALFFSLTQLGVSLAYSQDQSSQYGAPQPGPLNAGGTPAESIARAPLIDFSLPKRPAGYAAQAANQSLLPKPGKLPLKPPAMTLHVEAIQSIRVGYLPVEFTLTTPAPTTVAQEITMRFAAQDYRGNLDAISCEQTFEFPAGKTSASCTMLVPKYSQWYSAACEVWIDGRRSDALSDNRVNVNQASNAGGPTFLIANAGANLRLPRATALALGHSGQRLTSSFSELPQRWLAYTGVDAVLIDAAELPGLVENYPGRASALLAWVRAGGTLVAVGPDDDWTGWQWDAMTAKQSKSEGQPVPTNSEAQVSHEAQGWVPLAYASSATLNADTPTDALLRISPIKKRFAIDKEPIENARRRLLNSIRRRATSVSQLFIRPHGLGAVITYPASNDQLPNRSLVDQPLIRDRLDWLARHGNSSEGENYDFNNFLIPGVGLAPVTEFQLLISLFVLVIGPLNYWLLTRRKKLPLILLTTPLAAGATTLLLFGYGWVSDGVGVRTRVRSVVLLDQTSKKAASWARISYYAGIAPNEGLVLPDDTAVYPILPINFYQSRYGGSPSSAATRTVEWDGAVQRLHEGWLASRTPTQYLSITSRTSHQQLIFKRRAFEVQADQLSVENKLGVEILSLAVQDHQGRHFWAEAIPVAGQSALKPAKYSDVKMKLSKLFSENAPAFPPGGEIEANSYRNLITRFSDNFLEAELGAVVSPMAAGFGNGCYVAITKTGILVELGDDRAQEENSFHVIKGRFANPSAAEASP